VNSWSGSIEVGVTALDPAELEFPSSATGLRGGSWVVSGCSVLRDGRSLREDFGPDLDALAEGDRVGVQATAGGELRLWVNGRDWGVAASGLPARVWAVVDLYGKCTQVTVVAPEVAEGMEGTGGGQEVTTVTTTAPNDAGSESTEVLAPSLTNEALLFHEKCGALIKLSNGHKTAERRRPLDEFNNGVVLTNRPLRDGEMFEEGDHIGLTRKANNALHFYINGVDQGLGPKIS
ncbi:hypothetical protein HGM15179_020690, partial [Zosterops borbonicus]